MANILYVVQFFNMESEPGDQGQRHLKHAKTLVEAGHQVTVITSDVAAKSAENSQHSGGCEWTESYLQFGLQSGLRIIRIPARPEPGRRVFGFAAGHLNFSLKALKVGFWLWNREHRRYNFVLGCSPPLVVAGVAYLLSLLNKADFYLDVSGLWCQTLIARQLIKKRFVIQMHRFLENWLYRKSHRLIVVSPALSEEIPPQAPGVLQKMSYIPNGADLELYQSPLPGQSSYLCTEPEDESLFHVNYAGVYNDDTDLETLLDAAAILQEQLPNVRFNLLGEGSSFEQLKLKAAHLNLKNVRFWDALPKNRISQFLMEGNVSVMTYRALDALGAVLPSMLFDYFAAGKPIVAAVPKGEVSRILKESRAGIAVEPENVAALVECIRWFYHHPDQGLHMGEKGRQYVARYFNRAVLVEDFLKLFPRVISMGANQMTPDRPAAVMNR